jgi:lipoprotein-anchoring transpeptidase ErfK/SrfK
MNYRALIALAAISLTGSSASEAKLRIFGHAPHASHAATVRARGPQPVPYHWTQGAAPKAHSDMVAEFGKVGLTPGQYLWATTVPTQGETRIVIDRLTQMAYVYRADKLVGAATVSTATVGRITPLGFWSVLEKRPFYRSKKYDNAPMPFMQRIDTYGIALHGGKNPGFPASHGCIRLPMKFAEKLYGLTKVGSKVVIEG